MSVIKYSMFLLGWLEKMCFTIFFWQKLFCCGGKNLPTLINTDVHRRMQTGAVAWTKVEGTMWNGLRITGFVETVG